MVIALEIFAPGKSVYRKKQLCYHSDKIVRAQSAEHPVTNKVLGEVATCLNLKTS